MLVPKVHGLFHEISAKDWKEAAPIIAGVSRMIIEIEKPDRTYVLSFGEENTHLHIMMVVRCPEHPAAYGGKLGLDLAYAIRSEKRELDAKLVAASVSRYRERVAEYIKRASA
ncbi:MAG: hypothetical protein M3436_02045 [Pseudomonadota bacterium]|nr:hypothetical protein [Pseudomonadota bacterium]